MPKTTTARTVLLTCTILAVAAGVLLTVRAINSTARAAGWVIHTSEVLAQIDDLDSLTQYPGAARVTLESIRALTLDNPAQQMNVKALAATQLTPQDLTAGVAVLRSEERSLLLKRIDEWYAQLGYVRTILVVLLLAIIALVFWVVLLIRRQEKIERVQVRKAVSITGRAIDGLNLASPDLAAIRNNLEEVKIRLGTMVKDGK